jgi:hypothetical protein
MFQSVESRQRDLESVVHDDRDRPAPARPQNLTYRQ